MGLSGRRAIRSVSVWEDCQICNFKLGCYKSTHHTFSNVFGMLLTNLGPLSHLFFFNFFFRVKNILSWTGFIGNIKMNFEQYN